MYNINLKATNGTMSHSEANNRDKTDNNNNPSSIRMQTRRKKRGKVKKK